MRHYINIISALILAALAGNSCVKESVAAIGGEGEPVELTLDVTSRALDKVIVKSWDPNDEDEAKVNDLRVYIFSENGALVGYKYFGKADLNFSADLDSDNGYNSSATLTGIKTKTGTAYIYAIANAITSQYQVTETDAKEITNIDETDLSSSNLTRENFLAATYSRQAGSYDPRDNTFLMSGYVNNGSPVKIQRKTGGTGVAEIVSPAEDKDKRLKLFKVFSKNKLTIETGNDAAGNAISFDPDYMEIHNVPKTVALLPDGTTDASDFETFERVVLDEKYLNFYLPENLQSKNKKNTISVWNDREKNTYSDAGKSFVNAPDNATYLVVHGRYRAGSYVGNVAYTIHLGDFGNNGSLDNFDVCRNFSYQYTLKINGVNNFIAEAKKEGDGTIAKDDPGSEGIVIKTTAAGMLHADCHYEARVMIFNKAEVKGLIDNNFGYILKIHTIFGESECLIVTGDGVYEATQYYLDKSSGKVPTPLTTFNTDGTLADPSLLLVRGAGEADFNWVHFVKNTGAAPSSSPSNSPGCLITSNHTKQNVCAYPGTDKTMSVFQFLKELYVAASTDDANGFFDSDGNVYVTCFIDENYYADREWTKYTNQTDSRRLYIANDFQLSKDGKSSYAEAKYVIEQNSIWTFYRLDNSLKPYGVETISEEEEIENFSVNYSGYSSYQDNWNGYTVASNYYKANSLYTPGNAIKIRSASTSEPAKQDLYTDAYRACMSRNRDENGNGKIDDVEVKWYLATVDQYKGLWIGESELPTQAKLFEPTDANWVKLDDAVKAAEANNTDTDQALSPWHFFTASTQAVFWPEEGASTSPWGADWSKASKVRCVRTLESNRDGRKDPDVFYDAPVKNADGSYDITLRVNKGAGRDFQSGPVPCTLERGEATQNKVSRKFRVDSGNLAGTFKRAQITSSTSSPDVLVKEDADVCWNKKNGSADEPWRVPNQKELLVMSVVASNNDNTFNLDNITNFLWSNTYFTGLVKNYKLFNNESQLTAMYKSSTISEIEGIGLVMLKDSYQFTISPGTSEGNVRCVMDVKE